MWEPRRLTTPGAFAACYRDGFICFTLIFIKKPLMFRLHGSSSGGTSPEVMLLNCRVECSNMATAINVPCAELDINLLVSELKVHYALRI
jgi:hypothetical protein